MAKSKTGGTRTYIRGRVGSDVYSIGRDAAGNKQQIVRSLAESVANPQTIAQMRGRAIMYTTMQAQSALHVLVDHSFDKVSGVQQNLSEFTRRNYALIKADIAANPSENNEFGINQYKEKGIKQGAYIISDGNAAIPANLALASATGVVSIELSADAVTIAGLKAALGMTAADFFTIAGISATAGAVYCRCRINGSLDDTTAITSANIADAFLMEGNKLAVAQISGNLITLTLADASGNCGVIVSFSADGGYIHNTCVLSAPSDPVNTFNDAFPTYPIGEQKFLNGGDIFGLDETTGGGSSPEPTPSTAPPNVTQITYNGSVVQKDARWATKAYNPTIAVTIDNSDALDGIYYLAIGKNANAIGNAYDAAQAIQITSATTSINTLVSDKGDTWYACIGKNGVVSEVLGSFEEDSGDE